VASGQTLINLENVTKIFYTDEVETHALSGIHLDIKKANTLPSPARQAAANQHCSPLLVCWIHLRTDLTS